jgi:hypothetical protein
VSISAGASLFVSAGTFNAGGTGDPFTDTTTGTNLPVVNNGNFNITAGFKNVASIGGTGVTTVSAGAFLDVGSLGPVTQGTLTVNGGMDAGDVNVSGTTTVGASPASLVVSYLRGGTLSIGGGNVQIKQNGGAGGVCNISTVSIPSGLMDLVDNHLVTDSALGTWNGANYDGITGLIQSGRGTGVWDGTTGITTTMSDATTGVLTSLGVGSGAEIKGLGPTDTDVWAGQTVNGNSTLAMYTWGGDADLNGELKRRRLFLD